MKAETKKASKKDDDQAAAALRLKMVNAAKSAILKTTGQKPVAENLAPRQVVSSGSSCIDDLIGGSLSADGAGPKCPGYPRRVITEIYGAESSGKTTAALQAIAECQRQGGLAMFLDFEHALDDGYAKKVGVSFAEDKLIRYEPETIEMAWKMIYVGIKAGVDLLVVDSVAAMLPNAELNEKKPGDAPKIGAVASAMAQNLPKICIWLNSAHSTNPKGTAIIVLNQIRAAISTGGGGGQGTNENTPGGHALKFYAGVRLKLTRIKSEFVKKKDKFTGRDVNVPLGNHTRVKLVKSKIDGKQGFTTDIFIRFNFGIDDIYSLIEAAVQQKVLRKEGSYYDLNGQRFQGREKFRQFLLADKVAFNSLRAKVLAAVRTDGDVSDEDLEDDDSIYRAMQAELDDAGDETTGEQVPSEVVEDGGEEDPS